MGDLVRSQNPQITVVTGNYVAGIVKPVEGKAILHPLAPNKQILKPDLSALKPNMVEMNEEDI